MGFFFMWERVNNNFFATPIFGKELSRSFWVIGYKVEFFDRKFILVIYLITYIPTFSYIFIYLYNLYILLKDHFSIFIVVFFKVYQPMYIIENIRTFL